MGLWKGLPYLLTLLSIRIWSKMSNNLQLFIYKNVTTVNNWHLRGLKMLKITKFYIKKKYL